MQRFWTDLVNRPGGPLWKIARSDAATRKAALREGLHALERELLLGAVMDVIHRVKAFGAFKYRHTRATPP